jgi:hypothetical protein
MRFRKLRIAFSAMCGVLCLLLIVLWVRSYRHWDFGGSHNGFLDHWTTRFDSISGILRIEHSAAHKMANMLKARIGYAYEWKFITLEESLPLAARTQQRLQWKINSENQEVIVPYWCLTLICGIVGAVPWIRWKLRFSLRTLLIATTLVAVALGLIAWLGN